MKKLKYLGSVFLGTILVYLMLLIISWTIPIAFALNRVQLSPEYIPNKSIGRALANADIYVGKPDLNPTVVANQKSISVLQEDGSIVSVTQPISTGNGGVPQYNGSPVTILVDGNYSLKVLDSSGSQIYYVPNNSYTLGEPTDIYFYLSDYDDIDDAVTTIGATEGTLIIDCDEIMDDGNVTTPKTLNVQGTKGNILTLGTNNLRFNGSWQGGNFQSFDENSTGVVSFGLGALTELNPIWWGENTTHGTTDMTTEIENCIAAAQIPNTYNYRTIVVPDGTYLVSGALDFLECQGIVFRGAGPHSTIFHWGGDAATPMFYLRDSRDCTFENFGITSDSGAQLLCGIQSEQHANANVTPSHNICRNIIIEGTEANGLDHGIRLMTGDNANDNDLHSFYDIRVNNYDLDAFYLDHSDVLNVAFYNCEAMANGIGSYVVYANNGYFRWEGGKINETATADFYFANPAAFARISGLTSTESARLLETAGPAASTDSITISSCDWTSSNLNVDERMIVYQYSGPLILIGNKFGATTDTRPKVYINSAQPSVSFISKGNAWYGDTSETPYEFNLTTTDAAVFDINDIHYNSAGTAPENVVDFTDGDATPAVYFGDHFRTNSSTKQFITGLDDGWHGKVITIEGKDGGNSVLVHSLTLALTTGTNCALENANTITLKYTGAGWVETSRSTDGSPLGIGRGIYDYSADGTIAAGSTFDLGYLPDNAFIIEAYYEVLTTFQSATDAATLAIGIQSDDVSGIVAAKAISHGDNIWDAAGLIDSTGDIIQDGTAANATTKTTSERAVRLENTAAGAEALTAGKIRVIWKYIKTD